MRIVIAEDAVLLRAGLVRLLTDAGHQVVAETDTAEGLVKAMEEHRPDFALVDVRLPPTFSDEGIRAAVLIRRQDPEVPLLVLSQYVEERYAADLIASDTKGFGYLLKDRVADVPAFLDAVPAAPAGAVSPGATTRRRSVRIGSLRAPVIFIGFPEWLTPFDATAVKGF